MIRDMNHSGVLVAIRGNRPKREDLSTSLCAASLVAAMLLVIGPPVLAMARDVLGWPDGVPIRVPLRPLWTSVWSGITAKPSS